MSGFSYTCRLYYYYTLACIFQDSCVVLRSCLTGLRPEDYKLDYWILDFYINFNGQHMFTHRHYGVFRVLKTVVCL